MTALPGIQQDHLDKPALEPVGKCLRTVLLNCIVSNSQQRGNYLVSKRSQIVQKFLMIYALFPDNDDEKYICYTYMFQFIKQILILEKISQVNINCSF